MNLLLYWSAFLAVIGCRGLISAQNIDFDESGDHQVTNNAEAIGYFCANSWCPSNDEAHSIITLEQLQEYITAFQRIYDLEVTGDLTAETKELMSMPRCGYPDFGEEGFDGSTRKKRFTRIGGAIWDTNRVVTWFIENRSNDGLSDSVIESEILRAFQHWDIVSGITLMKAPNAASADIRMSFVRANHGDGSTFDGSGGTLAHAFGPGRSSIAGDVHFDDDEVYSIVDVQGINLHQVATHEIGHSLGLGHSTNRDAVMAPFYNYRFNFELHFDDINGIVDIYGPQLAAPRMTLPPEMPTITTTTTEAPTPTPPPRPPIDCRVRIDAVANSFDGGLYFFQGVEVFKVNRINGELAVDEGYPKLMWEEFPGVYTAYIDAAVLFRYQSGTTILYIFNGDLYWRIQEGNLVSGYPLSITANWGGIPAYLDAAYFWTGNSYLYFVKGGRYYRYSFTRRGLDYGYPRNLINWGNVKTPVTGAVDFEGVTYFFQEQTYQEFYDRFFSAGNPNLTAPTWFGCGVQNFELEATTMANDDVVTDIEGESMTCGTGRTLSHSLPALICVTLALITGLSQF